MKQGERLYIGEPELVTTEQRAEKFMDNLHQESQFMRDYSIDTVIFSTKSPIEVIAMRLMEGSHMVAQTSPCIGSYKGKLEVSYVADLTLLQRKSLAYELVSTQESILLLSNQEKNGSRAAYFYYIEDEVLEFIGYFGQTDVKDINLETDGFTYNIEQDKYFTIKS